MGFMQKIFTNGDFDFRVLFLGNNLGTCGEVIMFMRSREPWGSQVSQPDPLIFLFGGGFSSPLLYRFLIFFTRS